MQAHTPYAPCSPLRGLPLTASTADMAIGAPQIECDHVALAESVAEGRVAAQTGL